MNSIARMLSGASAGKPAGSPGGVTKRPPIPSFGPKAATPFKGPGASPAASVQDMLSRPKRTRMKGYKKTAEKPASASGNPMASLALPAIAKLAQASAAPAGAPPGLPPGGGPSMAGY